MQNYIDKRKQQASLHTLILCIIIAFFSCHTAQKSMITQEKDTKMNSGALSNDSVLAPGAKLQLISDQFSFTEGAAVDKAGNVFFTDQPNNKIWKYSTDGKLTVFLDKSGRSNGMFFDSKGNLITCADDQNELWSIDKNGKATVLLKDYKGKKLNGPNDLWIHPTRGD